MQKTLWTLLRRLGDDPPREKAVPESVGAALLKAGPDWLGLEAGCPAPQLEQRPPEITASRLGGRTGRGEGSDKAKVSVWDRQTCLREVGVT